MRNTGKTPVIDMSATTGSAINSCRMRSAKIGTEGAVGAVHEVRVGESLRTVTSYSWPTYSIRPVMSPSFSALLMTL
jgi:hypothetical protein